jgi:hypothetical protein
LNSPSLAAQSFALFSNRYPAACGGVVHSLSHGQSARLRFGSAWHRPGWQ